MSLRADLVGSGSTWENPAARAGDAASAAASAASAADPVQAAANLYVAMITIAVPIVIGLGRVAVTISRRHAG